MSRINLPGLVLAALFAFGAGCGGPAAGPTMPTYSVPAATTARPVPAPPWGPDPKHAGQLTGTGRVGRYELSLPAGFAILTTPATPAGVETVTWKREADKSSGVFGESLTLFTGAVLSDPKAVAGAADPRQFLIDFSAGMTDKIGVAIRQRGPTETGTLAGLPFTRFTWTGEAADGNKAAGSAYVAVDGASVVTFVVVRAGVGGVGQEKVMESAVATLRKK